MPFRWQALLFGITLVLCVGSSGLTFGNTYAPVADFTPVHQNPHCRFTALHETFLKDWTPPKDYFKIPPYPNAILLSAMPSKTAHIQGKEYRTFPSAVLLSPDSPQQIIAYYKKILGPAWFQTQDLGIMYLYRMPRPFNSGKELTQQIMNRPGHTPHIALDSRLSPCDLHIARDAKTRITVVSAPR